MTELDRVELHRGIIFRPDMAQAIAEGRKTQTRRVVSAELLRVLDLTSDSGRRQGADHAAAHGAPGDYLYVRESWMAPAADRPGTPDGRRPHPGDRVYYRGNPADEWQWSGREGNPLPTHCVWRPSIHMPRWAARTYLLIDEVRVERVQEINEEDAEDEGVEGTSAYDPVWEESVGESCRTVFSRLWDEIHGPGSWERNDWVWVYVFHRVERQDVPA